MTSVVPQVDTIRESVLAREQRASPWLPAVSLCTRELVRFFRQRSRIVGALGSPLIFWILFGAGLRGSFRAPAWAPAGMSYQEYFLPGVAVMILMFTAIFSTISIIEDRREGFLQAVLVAPIPRSSLVLGKIAGGTLLALSQVALFLLIGPLVRLVGLAPETGLALSAGSGLAVFAFLTLLAFGLTALGYLIAWPLDSTQGFHAIMNVFLMPMWLLSGAFFPVPETGWLAWVMRLNPLTYGVVGLQRLIFGSRVLAGNETFGGLPGMATCIAVTMAFAAICFTAAWLVTSRRESRNAQ